MKHPVEEDLLRKLNKRESEGGLRKLVIHKDKIDFCSNDYLGLSKVDLHIGERGNERGNGSTGSRLISGNYPEAEELESFLCVFHKLDAALLYNSGYSANLGLISALSSRDSVFYYDELIHASVRDGLRLGFGKAHSYRHNDLKHLEDLLAKDGSVKKFVLAESLYSMDGDIVPLKELVELCEKHSASLILDEAHSTGIFGERGEGLAVEQGIEDRIFARVYTFGKAIGCHGAAVGGSQILKDFLVNFSRPFIYSTFMPPAEAVKVLASYNYLIANPQLLIDLRSRIALFRSLTGSQDPGPIQVISIRDNKKAKDAEKLLLDKGFAVKAVLPPTVPEGEARLRICIHVHNSDEEISELYEHLQSAIN